MKMKTMKMNRVGCFLLFLLCFSWVGCEKATEYNPSPRDNFEALWRIMDENYCFFAFKDVDWDEVHDRYSLLVKDTMNQYELFDVLGEMLAEVKDGHTNLISSFDMSRYWAWYEDYPPNFYEEIQKNYLGTDYHIAGGLEYKRLADDRIGYVYYESFSSGVGESNLDYMFLHFQDCEGLIIDVRNNGGGALTNADRIASRFLEERMLTGYIQYKNGNGHNDFSDPEPVYLSPSEYIRWLRPVVVLTNRHSYSATNDFVNTMRLLPHVRRQRVAFQLGTAQRLERPFLGLPDAGREQRAYGIWHRPRRPCLHHGRRPLARTRHHSGHRPRVFAGKSGFYSERRGVKPIRTFPSG